MIKKKKKKLIPSERKKDGEITVFFGSDTFRGNYVEDLQVNELKINEMLSRQPSLYAFWGGLVAKQRYIYEKKKLDFETFEASLYRMVRTRGEGADRKVTESWIRAEIYGNPDRQRRANDLLMTQLKLNHLTAIERAFSQRKDMLMSLGANLREEMDVDLAIKEKRMLSHRLHRQVSKVRAAVEEEEEEEKE